MTHIKADLTGAQRIYALSNVPLFLLRRLQADPGPRTVSSNYSSQEILDELARSLKEKPRTLRDAVTPYVLLVALEQKRDLSSLQSAASLDAHFHDWYSYLASILVQSFTSTLIVPFTVPGQMQGVLASNTSSSHTTPQKIILTS